MWPRHSKDDRNPLRYWLIRIFSLIKYRIITYLLAFIFGTIRIHLCLSVLQCNIEYMSSKCSFFLFYIVVRLMDMNVVVVYSLSASKQRKKIYIYGRPSIFSLFWYHYIIYHSPKIYPSNWPCTYHRNTLCNTLSISFSSFNVCGQPPSTRQYNNNILYRAYV